MLASKQILYTCLKTSLTENVFRLTLTLILFLRVTVKHNNVLVLQNDVIFLRKWTDTPLNCL